MDPISVLIGELAALRNLVAGVELALPVETAVPARLARHELVAQIDDYLLPRLRQLDAPLLMVVGGSTGAGKSTLVNSLVGTTVSASGVLRPTTRAPVLVCNPEDAGWFAGDRVLPRLARSTGHPAGATGLHLVADDRVPVGLALLDAPDIDSVVSENRDLARQLLAAADLWLFVTTAARYADAVPWELLHAANSRSTALAIVLNRVPPVTGDEIAPHLREMLVANGLGSCPLFVIEEGSLDPDGLVRAEALGPIRGWLSALGANAEARASVVRGTLEGALRSVPPRVAEIAATVDDQRAVAAQLQDDAQAAYERARLDVDDGISSGSLLRGEVLSRWQDFVGTGEFMRSLESRIGVLRDRLREAITGRRVGSDLKAALESSVESLVRSAADRAAGRAYDAWMAVPAGRVLLDGESASLSQASAGLPAEIERQVRDWQGYVLTLVAREGAAKRTAARFVSYSVNAAGLAVMVAVFAHTGGLTGGEVAVAGGTSALGQKLLEAVFGDQAVRELALDARTDLLARAERLLESERARFDQIAAAAVSAQGTGDELRLVAERVAAASRVALVPSSR